MSTSHISEVALNNTGHYSYSTTGTHVPDAFWCCDVEEKEQHSTARTVAPNSLDFKSWINDCWVAAKTNTFIGWMNMTNIIYNNRQYIYMTYICHIHSQFIMTCVLVSFEGYWMMLVFHSERKLPTKAPQRIINTQSTLISTFSPSNNGYTLPQTNIDIHRPWKYAIPKGN